MHRICLLIIALHLYCLSATILFDMNGVISYQHKIILGYNAGLPLATYMIYQGIQTPRRCITEILQAIPYPMTEPIVPTDDIGEPLAPIMVAWLKGDISGYEVLTLMNQYFVEHPPMFNPIQQQAAYSIAHALFDPKLFAQATYLYDETVALVKECKTLGHTLYILSNWDQYSFIYVYNYYRTFFALFDAIIISGNIHLVKPNPAIYEYVIQQYHLDPARTVLIDDQHINIRIAQECGLFAIQCPSNEYALSNRPDISRVRATLDDWLHHIQESCFCSYNKW